MSKYGGILISIIGLVSCKATAPNSSVKDIGVDDRLRYEIATLFSGKDEDGQGAVFFKKCVEMTNPPRSCTPVSGAMDLPTGGIKYHKKIHIREFEQNRNLSGLTDEEKEKLLSHMLAGTDAVLVYPKNSSTPLPNGVTQNAIKAAFRVFGWPIGPSDPGGGSSSGGGGSSSGGGGSSSGGGGSSSGGGGSSSGGGGSETKTSKKADGTVVTWTRDESNPKLGEAWRDPSSMIWGDTVTNADGNPEFMNHKDATDYCNSISAKLPSREDFIRLREYMGAEPGRHEGYAPQVLPNLTKTGPEGRVRSRYFWSLSVSPNNREDAYIFLGRLGHIGSGDRSAGGAVSTRCVVSRR
jgi:hypothetical protein